MEDANLIVNQRIKKLRKELRLTQSELSKVISLSSAQIACIETGRRNVNDRTIKLICDSFSVSEKWLKTGEGDMLVPLEDAKFTKLNALFADLEPKYQRFILDAIEKFLKMQEEDE